MYIILNIYIYYNSSVQPPRFIRNHPNHPRVIQGGWGNLLQRGGGGANGLVQPFFFQLLEDLREATAQGVAMVGEADGPTKYAHDILYVNIYILYIHMLYVWFFNQRCRMKKQWNTTYEANGSWKWMVLRGIVKQNSCGCSNNGRLFLPLTART